MLLHLMVHFLHLLTQPGIELIYNRIKSFTFQFCLLNLFYLDSTQCIATCSELSCALVSDDHQCLHSNFVF